MLTVLAWWSELVEDLHLTQWERVTRATFITSVLVFAFRGSGYYFSRIHGNKSRWGSIAIVFLVACTLTFLFNLLVIDLSKEILNQSSGYLALLIFDMIVAFPILIAMFLSWVYHLFEKNKENQVALAELTTLRRESELNELKRQLNPHFLFNALSNIYSIAYLGDKETPDKIMQLSKMLRYVIYETDVELIHLSKEIEYLKYYIDFQKFRIEKEQQINLNIIGVNEDLRIAPLILLPFAENAFKHSQVASEPNAWVKIKLTTKDTCVLLVIENTIAKEKQPEILNNDGIGLGNIRKRLDLIYKDNFSLNISGNNTFKVVLEIDTK